MSANLSQYDEAAARYAPSETLVLFAAEPPPASIDRYFYYPDVRKHDHLWIGLMKALYPRDFGQTSEERKRKHDWLERFQADGYQLLDAVKEPGKTTRAVIRGNTARVIEEIHEIGPRRVVLIKATVYDALFGSFLDAGVPVVDQASLPFPGSGRQREFHNQFRELVESGRLQLAR